MRQATNQIVKQVGFTLIEVLVVAPLVILLIGVMLGFITTLTGDGLKAQQQNVLAHDTQAALDDIDSTAARAINFRSSTPPGLVTPQGPSDTAGSFSSGNKVLVLESVALTGNNYSDGRSIVYSENGYSGDCNTSSAPYTYYTVYFVTNLTLYKRTIMSTLPKCDSAVPQQKNSCSPQQMQLTTPPSVCKVEDETLMNNVTDFDISYLNSAGGFTSFAAATTVSVRISTQKSSAGTQLAYTGTLRTKKQPNTQNSLPQTPTVTGNNIADPDTFSCSWDKLANATNYSFQYRFNADAWTATTEPNTTSSKQIPVATKRDQKLECQVVANLTNGTTASYVPFVVNPIPLWTTPTLENNWVNYDAYYAGAGYTKTASGMIVLKGLIRSGTAPARAFQLPSGYRPTGKLVFQQSAAAVSGPSAAGRVDVESDGSVYVQGSANAWVSLAGINFMPSQLPSPFIAPTFSNSWTNYDAPSHVGAGYMQDSVGRLRVQGLIRSGVTTDGTLAFSIPANLRPAEYEHVAAHNGTFGVIGNGPTNGILAKGGSNTYLETNTLTYPASFNGWTNLTLTNGWARYPGFTTPKFTKGSDGLVMLKGLLQSGPTGYMFSIPGNLKLCPKDRHLFAIAAQGAYGRVDVEPGSSTGGCLVSLQAGSNVWTSLDAISWIGEI